MEREQMWAELQQRCVQCQACALCQNRKKGLLGHGALTAQVLMIAPYPTEADSRTGHLFSGADGALFWELLQLAHIDPALVYVTTLVKCPPPENRTPLLLEQHTCLSWLRGQTKLLAPKVIVCLGQEVTHQIMGQEVNLETHHGQWFVRRGVEMMAMHPPQDMVNDGGLRPMGFVDAKSLHDKLRQLRLA